MNWAETYAACWKTGWDKSYDANSPHHGSGSFPSEAVKRADDSSRNNQDNPFQWTVFSPMNHRESPHPSAAMRKALVCLTLLLLCAVTPPSVHAIPRRPLILSGSRPAEQTPYLPINGAPPLRFA